MSRDGSGVYHRPVGTDAVPDTTIESTKYNINVADVEQDLNLPRPIVAGGTGATSPAAALLALSGETAKQVVTNYDSQVWLPGSFYSATTALGTLPVAAHAFAGIAYYANATDLVLEATDLTEVSDPTTIPRYVRVMTAGVWGPWIRTNAGSSSAAASLGEYTFDSTLTFPPAAGQIRFNNATQNSTTEIFISRLTATGVDVTNLLPFALKSGFDIAIQDKDEVAKYKIFTTTADPVLSGTDYRVTVIFKRGGTDVVSTQRMLIGATAYTGVRYDAPQGLTAAQQTQARQNIYAAPFDAMAYNGIQINGGMEVSQENGAVGVIIPAGSGLKYIVDGWIVQTAGVQAMSAWMLPSATYQAPFGYNASLQISITTANTSPGNTDCCFFTQRIEGTRVGRLGYGSANASAAMLGFWVLTVRPGNYSGSLTNGTINNRSYPFVFTVNAASTWEYKTIAIPGDTGGTWVNNNTTALQICITMMAGANLCAAPGSWQAGNFIGATGTINGVASTSDTMLITGVFLLPGVEAPPASRAPFIMRPYDQELIVCNRYYQINSLFGPSSRLSPHVNGTYVAAFQWPTMRTIPTIAMPNAVSGATRGVDGAWNLGPTQSGTVGILWSPNTTDMSPTGGAVGLAAPTATATALNGWGYTGVALIRDARL